MLASTILSSFLTNLRILISPKPVARHKRRRQLPASSSLHAEVLEVRAMLSTAPVVSGVTVSNVSGTSATFSSNVVSDGGDPITDRGFVYAQTSTNGNPQIGGNGVLQVSTSGTIGKFSVPVTSLTAGAGYSIASYATNSQGTTYSNVTLLGSATAPTITGFTGAQTYHQGGAAISFASGITLADADSTTLSSATVSFTNWQAGDRLDFDNTFALQHTFTEDLNAHTATLSITGTGSLANYETTLQSMQFRFTHFRSGATRCRN